MGPNFSPALACDHFLHVSRTYPKNTDEFTPEEFRSLLGVPKGKLLAFDAFRRFAIVPAVEEVNALSSHMVQLDAIRHGRKVVKLRLIWFAKDEQGLKAAYCEVQRHKAERPARSNGSPARRPNSTTTRCDAGGRCASSASCLPRCPCAK